MFKSLGMIFVGLLANVAVVMACDWDDWKGSGWIDCLPPMAANQVTASKDWGDWQRYVPNNMGIKSNDEWFSETASWLENVMSDPLIDPRAKDFVSSWVKSQNATTLEALNIGEEIEPEVSEPEVSDETSSSPPLNVFSSLAIAMISSATMVSLVTELV